MILFDLFFTSGGLFTQPRDWLGPTGGFISRLALSSFRSP